MRSPKQPQLKKIQVDFNSIVENNTVRALRYHAEQAIHEDERVLMHDQEGHSAEGVVIQLQDQLAYIEIDWESWQTEQSSERIGETSDKIGLIIAMIAIVALGVAASFLLGNIWVGLGIGVGALLLVLFNQ